MRRLAVLLLALLVADAASGQDASAQKPEDDSALVSNRPGFSNVAEIVPKGRIELNTGAAYSEVEEDETQSYGQILVRAGIGGPWEVRIGLNSWTRQDGPAGSVDGIEDPTLGVKRALSAGSGRTGLGKPQASVIFQSSVPLGDNGITAENPQPAGILVLAWDLSTRVHLDNNLALTYRSLDDDNEYVEASATLAFSIALRGDWGTYLEYAGFFPTDSDFSDSHYLFAALTYLVNRKFVVDVGGGYGLNGLSPDYFVTGGLAYRW